MSSELATNSPLMIDSPRRRGWLSPTFAVVLLLSYQPLSVFAQTLVIKPHAAADFVLFSHPAGAYTLDHPSDWKAHEGTGRFTIGADNGLVPAERGFRTVYGAIVAIVDDPDAVNPARTIESSTRAVVDAILKRNAHQSLSVPVHADRPFGGAPSASAVLLGKSPVTGRGERAEVVVRGLGSSQILYVIFVSPTEAYAELEAPLRRMRDSLRVGGSR